MPVDKGKMRDRCRRQHLRLATKRLYAQKNPLRLNPYAKILRTELIRAELIKYKEVSIN
nr:79_t:CDS:2 [Entrophospora candida]